MITALTTIIITLVGSYCTYNVGCRVADWEYNTKVREVSKFVLFLFLMIVAITLMFVSVNLGTNLVWNWMH